MKKLMLLLTVMHLQQTSANWHTVFAHGIVDNVIQAQRFADAISTPSQTDVEFCDAEPASNWNPRDCASWLMSTIAYAITFKKEKIINLSKMHMGQGSDIEMVQKAVQSLPSNEKIILYGCSRGAATNINYMAECNPANVQALVLDGTPADMPSSIAPTLASLGIDPKYAFDIFCTIFPAYPKDSIPPIQAIKQIQNKNLPILLIHSKTDRTVTVQNSYRLYLEFQRQGFANVELVVLPSGNHSYLLQDTKIKPLYLQAVHAFYKKYNLPYDANWTNQGFNFDANKPSMKEMQDTITAYETNIAETYQMAIKRNLAITAVIIAILIKKYLD